MLSILSQWDVACFWQINSHWISPLLDKVMAVASSFSLFKIPLALGVVAMLLAGKFRERLFLVIMLLCVVVGDTGIDGILKTVVHRPRPHEVMENVRMVDLYEIQFSHPERPPKGRSFPSGHAFNNVALALVATVLYGRWALLLWPWAALVSYSRIYTGSHYPSDIVLSWLIAVAYTWVILKTLDWLWRRYAPTRFPKLYAQHPEPIFKRHRAGTCGATKEL